MRRRSRSTNCAMRSLRSKDCKGARALLQMKRRHTHHDPSSNDLCLFFHSISGCVKLKAEFCCNCLQNVVYEWQYDCNVRWILIDLCSKTETVEKIILIELKAKAQVNIFRPAAKFRFKTFACIFSNKGYWLNFAKKFTWVSKQH